MVCPECNKDFKGITGLSTHLSVIHKWNKNDTYLYTHFTGNGLEIPKCKICDKNIIYRSHRLLNTCGCTDCISKYNSLQQKKGFEDHPERRDVARKNRLNYLLNNKNFVSTAWGKRANRELSYLENWFVDNVINKYNLQDKYDIVNDYSVSPYFLDFAFINIKLDVELDGRCHFINGKKRIQHDIERDKFLLENGWKIFRISYLDNNENMIKQFIDYLTSEKFEYNEKYYNSIIIRGSDLYKMKLDKKKTDRLEKKQEKIDNIRLILSSLKKLDIDYSSFGWVKKVQKYLYDNGIKLEGNIRKYIKKYYPEFFDEVNPFTRKQ